MVTYSTGSQLLVLTKMGLYVVGILLYYSYFKLKNYDFLQQLISSSIQTMSS